MNDKDQTQKLIEIEKTAAKKSGFRQGLVVGIFIPVVLFSSIMIGLILSRSYVEKEIGEFVISTIVNEVFTAFPDAYFTNNREKVISIFDDFTNAASNHEISSAEFNRIGQLFLDTLRDKRLTYGELDQILESMKNSAK